MDLIENAMVTDNTPLRTISILLHELKKPEFHINRARMDGGGPLLNSAVMCGRSDVVQEIARSFMHVASSGIDEDGNTAMHVAMRTLVNDENSFTVVQQLLLLAGGMISLQMENHDRDTPLTILRCNNHTNSCPRTQTLINIAHKCLETSLVEIGMDPNENLHQWRLDPFQKGYLQSRCDLQIAEHIKQMDLYPTGKLRLPMFIFETRYNNIQNVETDRRKMEGNCENAE